jgi:sugar (pentulose or hexulose) kinase
LYFGFGLDGFTKEKLCRAVLEGHVMNLYEGYQRLPVKAGEIRLTGGMSKSGAWRQTIADVFNCTVVPVKGEGAALGAAIHAAYVDNKAQARDVAAFVGEFVELDEANRTTANPEAVENYASFKKAYLALSRRVRGVPGVDDPFAARTGLMG